MRNTGFYILFISLSVICSCNFGSLNQKPDVFIVEQVISDVEISDSLVFIDSDLKFRQLFFPLNNNDGVPFVYNENSGEFFLQGFEIDSNELFYFLGGIRTTLVAINENRQVFRRGYDLFPPTYIHLFHERMYLFDRTFNKNNLIVLDKKSGEIIESFENITKNQVSNFHFLDSSLVCRLFNVGTPVNIDTESGFVKFDLNGNWISHSLNVYDLPNYYDILEFGEFLGRWKEYNVFWNLTEDDKFELSLRDFDGTLIDTKIINDENFGEPFYGLEGNPQEHRKLRNGNIYTIGWTTKKEVVITVLPLSQIFEF